MPETKATDLASQVFKLREAGAECVALAHLFRLKRRDEAPTLDMDEINWGISRILEEIATKVLGAANHLEDRF